MAACKFPLETLLRITTLTDGEGEVTGEKHLFCIRDKGVLKLGFVILVSIYFVKDCLKKC